MIDKKLNIQGSAPEPYQVYIRATHENEVNINCSCPAGIYKKNCKHILGVLFLEPSYIEFFTNEELTLLRSIFEKNTYINELMNITLNLLSLEKEIKNLKAQKLKLLKKL